MNDLSPPANNELDIKREPLKWSSFIDSGIGLEGLVYEMTVLEKLLAKYNIDPDSSEPWLFLSWRLAREYVPAMRREKPGRPARHPTDNAVLYWLDTLLQIRYPDLQTPQRLALIRKIAKSNDMPKVAHAHASDGALSNRLSRFKKTLLYQLTHGKFRKESIFNEQLSADACINFIRSVYPQFSHNK